MKRKKKNKLKIRIPVPKPGKYFKDKTKYHRKEEKEKTADEIKEGES